MLQERAFSDTLAGKIPEPQTVALLKLSNETAMYTNTTITTNKFERKKSRIQQEHKIPLGSIR